MTINNLRKWPERLSRSTSSVMSALAANHPRGIRVRSCLAVVCALTFIIIDVIFVAYNYDLLPDVIPAFEDAEGIFIKAVQKSSYIGYDIQRLVMLVSAFLVAWAIKPGCNPLVMAKKDS